MRKNFLRVAAMLLTATILFSPGLAAHAETEAADADGSLLRIFSVMNGDTENSRGISWATAEKTDSIVYVSESETMNDSVEFTGTVKKFKDYYIHKVTADGLKPGTTYYYTVGDGTVRSRVCSFATDKGRGNAVNILAFADVQASSHENFSKAAQVVKAGFDLFDDVDFSVNLGDYVNDCTNEEWNWYYEEFSFLNDVMSSAPVAGNHDGNLKWNWFKNMFNIGEAEGSATITGCYYSFDYGDAHFAVLNTNDMYPMTKQQVNWLKNDMNHTDATWKIVMLHRSFYSAGKHTNKPDSLIMRNVLLPVIDELGIDLVLGGHEHMYLRTKPVYGKGEVPETTYIKEIYNGEETTFAVDPAGTIHVMPSTAGTKRYLVNNNAMDYILDAAAIADTTRDKGGIVTNLVIDGDKLVYKAYLVDIESGETSVFDEFAIKKTATGSVNEEWKDRTVNKFLLSFYNVFNFVRQIIWVIGHYLFNWLPKTIANK